MKIFTMLCIDNETGLEIIASDLSFNFACSFLDSKMPANSFVGCKSKNNITEIFFKNRNFVYDENRALLLGR